METISAQESTAESQPQLPQQHQEDTVAEAAAPFWRLPPPASPENNTAGITSTVLPVTAPPPPALASSNTYSTSIVDTGGASTTAPTLIPELLPVEEEQKEEEEEVPTSSLSNAAMTTSNNTTETPSSNSQPTPIYTSTSPDAAAVITKAKTSTKGSGGASPTNSPTASPSSTGPRWTDRRNLSEEEEAELQHEIRNLVLEAEECNNGLLTALVVPSKKKKKQLLLDGLSLSEADIPVDDILLGTDHDMKLANQKFAVAPQWIKAAASSQPNDSHETAATTMTAGSVLSVFDAGKSSSSSSNNNKKGGKVGGDLSSGGSSSNSNRTPLAKNLHTLSLSRNRYLLTIPQRLVSGNAVRGAKLSNLKYLDISSCAIQKLPDEQLWDLPQLKSLNLSLNRLQDFPNQNVLGGLPQLKELNLYGNRLSEICHGSQGNASGSISGSLRGCGLPMAPKLESLNVAFNDLVCLPETLPFPKLESLIASHNFLASIPAGLVILPSTSSSSSSKHRHPQAQHRKRPRPLRLLDVTSNPLTQPPAEVCERGLAAMRRYYQENPPPAPKTRQSQSHVASSRSAGARRLSTASRKSRDLSVEDAIRLLRENKHSSSSSGEQDASQDADRVFQKQLLPNATAPQARLLSRSGGPSHEVPMFINVASSASSSSQQR